MQELMALKEQLVEKRQKTKLLPQLRIRLIVHYWKFPPFIKTNSVEGTIILFYFERRMPYEKVLYRILPYTNRRKDTG